MIHAAFNRQMAKFNVAAKLTQSTYGTNSAPAAVERRQNNMVVARMADQSNTSSKNAKPGRWKAKNSHDQAAFNTNWTANIASGSRALDQPSRRHTNHAANAMLK